MNAPINRDIILASLREEIDTLRETVRQLREELAPVRAFPAAWKLTRQQATTLSCIMAASPGVAQFSRIIAALYQYGEPADSIDDMLTVLIYGIRTRLQTAGVEVRIRSVFGVGYTMTRAERDRLLAWLNPEEDAEPAWWDKARRLRTQGLSFRKIAKACGKSDATVRRIMSAETRASDIERRRVRRLVAEANKQEAA